jgi:hypothetical protein
MPSEPTRYRATNEDWCVHQFCPDSDMPPHINQIMMGSFCDISQARP